MQSPVLLAIIMIIAIRPGTYKEMSYVWYSWNSISYTF